MMTTKLIAALIKSENKCLYTYPGGTIAPVFHECIAVDVPIICAKSEQGAGFMAIADALVTGTPSFVAVTSGPGATNMITCIADAFYDSIPLIIFTGQVGTKDLSGAAALRQRGFQETPIVEMVRTITKASLQPSTPQKLADALVLAMKLSKEGRPGPVLIDLPMDMQMAPLPVGILEAMLQKKIELHSTVPFLPLESKFVADLWRTLADSSRPLILAGAGGLMCLEELKFFAGSLGIPVVTSMRGLGAFPSTDNLSAGWIGHTGMPWANWALSKSDWLLVLGSRLDVRQTGTLTDLLAEKTIFHVDIDSNELAHGRIPLVRPLHCSVENFFSATKENPAHTVPDFSDWVTKIAEQKCILPLQDRGKAIGIPPYKLFNCIHRLTVEQRTAVVTGVGSHQQWAARYFTYDAPDKLFFTSAGHGTMGYSLPVALGLKRLQPERLVISVDGDGSFQMNIQELAMIKELEIPLKILIIDNNRLGIVSQFQNLTFGDDPVTGSFYNPDFIRIAEAYGVKAYTLYTMDDESVVEEWLHEAGPALLRAYVQHDAPVSPMLLAGQTLENMWYAEEKR